MPARTSATAMSTPLTLCAGLLRRLPLHFVCSHARVGTTFLCFLHDVCLKLPGYAAALSPFLGHLPTLCSHQDCVVVCCAAYDSVSALTRPWVGCWMPCCRWLLSGTQQGAGCSRQLSMTDRWVCHAGSHAGGQPRRYPDKYYGRCAPSRCRRCSAAGCRLRDPPPCTDLIIPFV